MGGRLELLGIVVKQQTRYGSAHPFRGPSKAHHWAAKCG
jgi:hypothetical protein